MGSIDHKSSGSFEFRPQFSCLPRLAAGLFIAIRLSALAETNSPAVVGTASTALIHAEASARRAELAAEQAETAAKQAVVAARRTEAVLKQLSKQPPAGSNSTHLNSATNFQSRVTMVEDDELRRVRFTAASRFLNFNDVEREARAWLTKEGQAPPKDLVAMFEVFDGEVFVTVKFGQQIGKRFWYVKFDRDLEVEEWGSKILKESK